MRNKQSTRDKAAAARAQQLADEKRRTRTRRIAGTTAVAIAITSILGVAVFASSTTQKTGALLPEPNDNTALPAGVLGADSPTPWAVPYNTEPINAPLLELWEDFQCPACAAVEEINGAGIRQLADSGKIQLVYRPTAFLDANNGTTSSAAAINAWGCAIDQNKTTEYQKILLANQPPPGQQWTQEQLIGYAENVGITGQPLQQFDNCITNNTYLGWAANSTEAFFDNEVQGTPKGYLNGVVIDGTQLADQAALIRIIEDAAQ